MIVLQDGVALGVSGSPSGTAGGALAGSYPNPSLATSQSAVIAWGGLQDFDAGMTVATGQTVAGDAELTLKAASGQPVTIDIGTGQVVQFQSSGSVYVGARTAVDGGAGTVVIGGSGATAGHKILIDYSGILYNFMRQASGTFTVGDTAFGPLNLQGTGGPMSIWSKGQPVQVLVDNSGATVSVGIGGATLASAVLEANSTTQGFAPPRMTTTQKNAISSPTEGLEVYDLTLHALCVYNGTGWKTVTAT